jgi:hypothetical protein
MRVAHQFLTLPVPPTSTPDESPASNPPSSLGSRKKVNFSSWTNIHQAADASTPTEIFPVRPLPPSRECSTSGKSILKSNGNIDTVSTATDGPADPIQSLDDTMESIVQQLARNDTIECVDAYQTLVSIFRAYEEIPDAAIFRNRLPLIAKAIKLHLTVLDQSQPQPSDINLVTSALKFVVILVWNKDFAQYIPDDFKIHVLDRAITTIAEHRGPKSVIVHYLHFLAMQEFRQSLMNSSRAARLIDGLAYISDHFKGNGVASERLLVYTRLLDQAPTVMLHKAGLWIEHMLSAMVSSLPDTQSKALALGNKAHQRFPSSSSLSNMVRSVLEETQDDGVLKGVTMCTKLTRMLSSDNQALNVPQVWAVIIMLCNNTSSKIDSWPALKTWLTVIQRCFNASDSALRCQANQAWNRFVFVARPHEASDGLLSMLVKPIVNQLERQSAQKPGKSSHAAAVESYCNLLYYAFRPATSPSRLTKAWNECIVKVVRSSFCENRPTNADLACRILMALFWNGRPGAKVWNENRALEKSKIEPEELPVIEGKWVRSRVGPILLIFEVLFRYSAWGFAKSSEQAYVSKAWRNFVRSVRSASNKEVVVSTESRSSTLSILRFLDKLKPEDFHPHDINDPNAMVHTSVFAAAVAELSYSHILDIIDQDKHIPSAALLNALADSAMVAAKGRSLEKAYTDSLLKLSDALDRRLAQAYADGSDRVDEVAALFDVVARVTTTVSVPAREYITVRIQHGLGLWCQDENHRLPQSVVEKLSLILKQSIGLIPSALVISLDGLFASAFGSTHRTIVSAVASAWNDAFSTCNTMEIGQDLIAALQRLRPYVELTLPSGCIEGWTQTESTAPTYNTQDRDEHEVVPIPMDSPSDIKTRQQQAIKSIECSSRSHTPRKNKPGHEDSQVEFVPMVSSPPEREEESQFLTEHQKEVRDRQRSEPAVVFPDLRSSPRPANRAASENRDCGFARKAATLATRPSTPPLPDVHDDIDAQPSPTPRSRLIRNVAEVDIPSSPPSLHGAPDKPLGQGNTTFANEHSLEEMDETDGAQSPLKVFAMAAMTAAQTEQPRPAREEGIDPAEVAVAGESNAVASVVGESLDERDGKNPESDEAGETTDIMREANVGSPVRADPQEISSTPVPEAAELQEILAAGPSTPAQGSKRIDSDELEQMSASQLAEDLDWSVVLDGLDEIPAPTPTSAIRSDRIAVSEPELPESSQASNSSRTSRKRKSRAAGWTRNKRAKKSAQAGSQNSQTSTPALKIEEGSADFPEEEEIFDMIEVVTSSDPVLPDSPVAETGEEVFVDAPESQEEPKSTISNRRKRGRPSSSRSKLMPPPSKAYRPRRSVYSQSPSIDMDDGPRNQSVDSSRDVNMADDDKELCPVVEILVPSREPGPEGMGTEVIEEEVKETPHGVGSIQSETAAPMDVLASLQQVLERVKSMPAGSIDLRAVDELCFQIRYEAQTAVRQS